MGDISLHKQANHNKITRHLFQGDQIWRFLKEIKSPKNWRFGGLPTFWLFITKTSGHPGTDVMLLRIFSPKVAFLLKLLLVFEKY
jgi:hypothetical protein